MKKLSHNLSSFANFHECSFDAFSSETAAKTVFPFLTVENHATISSGFTLLKKCKEMKKCAHNLSSFASFHECSFDDVLQKLPFWRTRVSFGRARTL